MAGTAAGTPPAAPQDQPQDSQSYPASPPAVASHRPALLATGLIGTGVYLIRYYYQLDVPLLEKSQWLLLGGVALLAIRFVLARTAPRVDAGDHA